MKQRGFLGSRSGSQKLALLGAVALVGAVSAQSVPPPVVIAEGTGQEPETDVFARVAEKMLPVSFEANSGQTDPNVKLLVKGAGPPAFLTSSEAVFTLPQSRAEAKDPGTGDPVAVRMSFEGGDPGAAIQGVGLLPGVSNYIIGNDPSNWRTGVPSYAQARYSNVYPGVDVLFRDSGKSELEYDFIVAPGAEPDAIALRFAGARGLAIDHRGDLVLTTANGQLRHRKPSVYQDVDGSRQAVRGKYVLNGSGTVRFDLGRYDTARPLVIDPVLEYATYLRGTSGGFNSADDSGRSIAVDSSGSAHVTGLTQSVDFPTQQAFQPTRRSTSANSSNNAFVTKFSPSGDSLVYSTYLGGSGVDTGHGIAVDQAGNAYVAGQAGSQDFPTTPNAYQPTSSLGVGGAFLTRFDTNGVPRYSTYLTGNFGASANAVAVGSSGVAYVTGATTSRNFPTTENAFQKSRDGGPDAFITAIDTEAAGSSSLRYSSYLGGASSDVGTGIAVDPLGTAYITGGTSSGDFDVVGAQQSTLRGIADAFIASVSESGSLKYSTLLGGNGADGGTAIAVDSAQNTFITGFTQGMSFPLERPYQSQASGPYSGFITQLSPGGSISYSSYLGGNGDDRGHGIALDGRGGVYVAGETGSSDFPTLEPLQYGASEFQLCDIEGGPDAFVSRVDTAVGGHGSLISSTCYGGRGGGESATAIAVDADHNPYITGATYSGDLPTRNAFQDSYSSNADVFVAKIVPTPPSPFITGIAPSSGSVAGGSLVTITGTGFIDPSIVTFDTSAASDVKVLSDTRMTVVSPPHAVGPVRVNVTTLGGESPDTPADDFTYYLNPPTVTSIAPSEGPVAGGRSVTISGTGFTGGALTTVRFGNVPAAVASSVSVNEITAVSPPHPQGVVDVTVSTPGGTSATGSATKFTYLPPPILTGIAPARGPATGGTSVFLTGTGLEGATAVRFGGSESNAVRVAPDGTVVVETPPHDPGVVKVAVITPSRGASGSDSAPEFTYLPAVQGLAPAQGPSEGGTAVRIGGKGFADVRSVTFDGVEAAVIARSDVEVSATSPAHSLGPARVSLITTAGLVSVPAEGQPSADLYTYVDLPVAGGAPTGGGGGGGSTRNDPPVQQAAPPGGTGSPAPSPSPLPGPSPVPSPGATPNAVPAASSGAAPASAQSPAVGQAGQSTSSAAPGAGAVGAPVVAPVAGVSTGAAPAPAPGAPGVVAAAGEADGEKTKGSERHAMVAQVRNLPNPWSFVLGGAGVALAFGWLLFYGCAAPSARRRSASPGADRPRPKGAY